MEVRLYAIIRPKPLDSDTTLDFYNCMEIARTKITSYLFLSKQVQETPILLSIKEKPRFLSKGREGEKPTSPTANITNPAPKIFFFKKKK